MIIRGICISKEGYKEENVQKINSYSNLEYHNLLEIQQTCNNDKAGLKAKVLEIYEINQFGHKEHTNNEKGQL